MINALVNLARAYHQIAQAPTQGYRKPQILDDLETLIEKEIKELKEPQIPPNPDDKIPF